MNGTDIVSLKRPDQNTIFKYLSKSYKKKKIFVNLKAKIVTQNFQQSAKNVKESENADSSLIRFNMKYKKIQISHPTSFNEDSIHSYRNNTTQIDLRQTGKCNQKYQNTYQDGNFSLNSKIYAKNSTMPTNLLKGFKGSGSIRDVGYFKLKSQVNSMHGQQFNNQKGDFSILEFQQKLQPILFMKRRFPTSLNNRNQTQSHLKQFISKRKIRTAQVNFAAPSFQNHRKFMTQQKHQADQLLSQSNINSNRYKSFTKTYSAWKINK